jgi:hypothetical protein
MDVAIVSSVAIAESADITSNNGFIDLYMYPEMGLLDHMVVLSSIL